MAELCILSKPIKNGKLIPTFKEIIMSDSYLADYWDKSFDKDYFENNFDILVDNFIKKFTEEELVGVTYDTLVVGDYLVFVMSVDGNSFIVKRGENSNIMSDDLYGKDLDRAIDFGGICLELKDLYTEKNRRYNDSFHKQFEEFGLTSAVMRLNDKMLRLKELAKNPDDCGDEPITDTLKDLANYAIMTLMELRKSEDNDEEQEECDCEECTDKVEELLNREPPVVKHLCPKCGCEVIKVGSSNVPYPYHCTSCGVNYSAKEIISSTEEV